MNILSPFPWYGAKYQLAESISYFYKRDGITTLIDGCGGSGKLILNAPKYETMIYNDLDTALYALFMCIKEKKLLFPFINRVKELGYSETGFRQSLAVINQLDNESEQAGEGKNKLKSFNLDDVGTLVKLAACKFVIICQSYNAGQMTFKRPTVTLLEMYNNRLLTLVDVHYRMCGMNIVPLNRDVFSLLNEYGKDNRKDVLFVLDVPYIYGEGEERKIGGAYRRFDWPQELHDKLLNTVKNNPCRIMICGYNNDKYNNSLVAPYWNKAFVGEVVKSAQRPKFCKYKSTGHEYIWYNYNI